MPSETIVDKWRNEGISIGEQRGEHKATANLTLLQLKRKIGTVRASLTKQIQELSGSQLQEPGIATI